jgi:hypothetical protein
LGRGVKKGVFMIAVVVLIGLFVGAVIYVAIATSTMKDY